MSKTEQMINFEFVTYTVFSAAALLLDYTVYWLLVKQSGMGVGLSATISYSAGLVLSYVLMSRFLFRNAWLSDTKFKEKALFLTSGLLGMSLTFLVTECYIAFVGESIHVAKISAIAVSFVSVYAFRRLVVFRAGAV